MGLHFGNRRRCTSRSSTRFSPCARSVANGCRTHCRRAPGPIVRQRGGSCPPRRIEPARPEVPCRCGSARSALRPSPPRLLAGRRNRNRRAHLARRAGCGNSGDFAASNRGREPRGRLREHRSRMRFATADELKLLPGGTRARAAGIVTGRQRPSTASGTVFVTLEDETGYVNVIVWPHLIERQRRELLGARLMGVEGVLEREGEVMHLIARRLSDHSALLGSLVTSSRDFH